MRPGISKFQVENHNTHNIKLTPNHKDQAKSQALSCFNHYDKMATHKLIHVDSSNHHYYCQKCAIMLASKGNNITKIASLVSSHKPSIMEKESLKKDRQGEINKFIQELSWNIEQINKRNNQIEYALKDSQQHFSNMITQVTTYYKEIEDLLEIQKYMNYNSILTQRASLESQLRLIRESLEAEIEELVGVGNDIQNNMEAVETVEHPIYESIMENYKIKLNLAYEYHQITIGLLEKPFVVFPEIPKIFYTLGQKLYLKQQQEDQKEQPISNRQLSERQSRVTTKSKAERSKSIEYKNKQNFNNMQENISNKGKKSFSHFIKNHAEDLCEKELAFSFEPNQVGPKHAPLRNKERSSFIFFQDKHGIQSYYPQEMFFRESLSLTQIRENDEEMEFNDCRRGKYGQQEEAMVMPQEIKVSQQSMRHYFVTESTGMKLQLEDFQPDQTETLLIC